MLTMATDRLLRVYRGEKDDRDCVRFLKTSKNMEKVKTGTTRRNCDLEMETRNPSLQIWQRDLGLNTSLGVM